jgi:hypothetical protein
MEYSFDMLTIISEVFDILRDAEGAVEVCLCESGCSKCTHRSYPATTKGLTDFQASKVVSAGRATKSHPSLEHTSSYEVCLVSI